MCIRDRVISFAEYTSGKRIAGIVNALTGIFYKAGIDVYKRQGYRGDMPRVMHTKGRIP